MKNKVCILIPYKLYKGDAGEELKMCLRSIEKNCKFNYEVTIVGDLPEWINPDKITHLNPPIEVADACPKAWNVIERIRFAVHTLDNNNILLTYDDIIFLRETKYADISQLVALEKMYEGYEQTVTASLPWKKVMQNTILALTRNKLPMYNYETHLPRLFSREKLVELFKTFTFKKRPYCIPTLYFNFFKSNKKIVVLEENKDQKIKANVYYPGDLEKYGDSLTEYQFLNWGSKNYDESLKKILLELFPEKSQFEL